jgi:NAD/NADP transhydrogenase beta subunit
MGHPFEIGMATGYSGVEIGYGEYMGYHHDSKMLFGSASSNIGTAVILESEFMISHKFT